MRDNERLQRLFAWHASCQRAGHRRDVVDHHLDNAYTNGYTHGQTSAPITHLSDEKWEQVRPILEKYDPPRRLGRKRIDQRGALDAIVYRLRSGCRWNHLPKEYPDDSSVHRTYQRWQRLGVLDRVMDTLGERRTAGVS
jgi:transposase